MQTFAREIAEGGQSRIDEAVTAVAWSLYKPESAKRLAEVAVEVTGIGNVASKIAKIGARRSERCAIFYA